MKQYPGTRGGGNPDSRAQQPMTGHRFGGGLHGMPREDAAVDPLWPADQQPRFADGDLLERQKEHFRAEAGETSIGSESGVDETNTSTGTLPNGRKPEEQSNLTGSESSTSAIDEVRKPDAGSKTTPN